MLNVGEQHSCDERQRARAAVLLGHLPKQQGVQERGLVVSAWWITAYLACR